MAKKPTIDEYKQFERRVLEGLDLAREWSDLVGLRIANDHTTTKGFLKCYDFEREESTPSAGICIEGELLGLYKSFSSGRIVTINFMSMAAKKRFNGVHKNALLHYAKQLKIEPPDNLAKAKSSLDSLAISDSTQPSPGLVLDFISKKDGVSALAIAEVGCQQGRYPSNWALEAQTTVLIASMYGSELLGKGPVTGYHIFSANPDKQIRKYAGKNKKHEEVKVISLGELGLMGMDGLSRLEDAEVVWFVEGISDLLAAQTVLDKSLPHVVLTAGGCGSPFKKEWADHFIGKTVYVCFDVGDKDNIGQLCAEKWCKNLDVVAREVRNVVLPLGPGGTKNDLRAWLVAGNRTYDDMLSLAKLTEVFKPEQAAAGEVATLASAAHQHILERLGCIVSGQIEGTNWVEIHSTRTGQRMVLKSLQTFTMHEAIILFGGDVASEVISLERDPEPGKVSVTDVRLAIASAACGRVVADGDAIGCGMWEVSGDIVLIGKNIAHRYTRARELIPITKPMYGGKRFDYGKPLDWYDQESMEHLLEKAADIGWRRKVVNELRHLMNMWDNWEFASNADLATGLILATWVETIWSYRPNVIVTGPTNSGKSTLVEGALQGVFNGLSVNVSRPSEPGVRQKIGNNACATTIDEFDRVKDRQKLLDLLRTGTRGSKMVLGSMNGKEREYGLRHICWCAGIETGITEEADQNRFIRLSLSKLDSDRKPEERLVLPMSLALKDLGHRLSAVALYTVREARELAEQITSKAHPPGVDLRYIQGLAVPAAMLAVNLNWSLDDTAKWVEDLAVERKISVRQTSDEEELIEAIQGSKTTEGGRQYTISSLIHATVNNDGAAYDFSPSAMVRGSDADRMLQANGIRLMPDKEFFFVHPRDVTRFLLQNTRFASMAIGDILERLPGAHRACQRISSHPKKGVAVPVSALFSQD